MGTRNYLDQNEFDMLIANIPELNSAKWNDQQIEFIFKISYWLGLRMSETCRLKAEDFDLIEMDVWLGKTKTNEADRAKIPPLFVSDLTHFLEGKTGDLFPDANRRTVHNWLIKLGNLLDIPALTAARSRSREQTKTHIFRKSIAKDYYHGKFGKPAPITIVAVKLRHKKITTTSDYIKVTDEALSDYDSKYLK